MGYEGVQSAWLRLSLFQELHVSCDKKMKKSTVWPISVDDASNVF